MKPHAVPPVKAKRSRLPLSLAFATLLGATALTFPFITSDYSPMPSSAQAAEQTMVPAAGFADLVEKIEPAVVSVQVKDRRVKTSSHRYDNQRQHGPDSGQFERFFERFGDQFRRQFPHQYRPQSYNGAQPWSQTPQRLDGDCDPQYQETADLGRDRTGEFERHGQEVADRRFQEIDRRYHRDRRNRAHTSLGSGFFISADGYVVTNNHVIKDAETVEIKTTDGQTYEARVVGSDSKTDLALLKVDADRTFEFVTFAEKSGRVGDWVIAVGNPFGLGGTVTTGIISAKGRDLGSGPYDDYLQIDAPINKGNSGGPAFNIEGKVVGVNTAIFSPTGGNVGIGFAIPASVAKQVIDDLMDDGEISRGWLGVQIQVVTDDIAESLGLEQATGALVTMVQSGSPAEKAGLEVGDLVLQVDGNVVESPKDLARKVAAIEPGSDVDFVIFRDGETITRSVSIGTQAKADRRADEQVQEPRTTTLGSLGLDLTSRNGSVVVSSVRPDGPAAEKGLKAGDEILEVGGEKVTSQKQFEEHIQAMSAKGRKAVLLLIKTDGGRKFVAVELKQG